MTIICCMSPIKVGQRRSPRRLGTGRRSRLIGYRGGEKTVRGDFFFYNMKRGSIFGKNVKKLFFKIKHERINIKQRNITKQKKKRRTPH